MHTWQTLLRPATGEDVEFLTDVSIEVMRDQGRLPADFDEAEFRARFTKWTQEQVRGGIEGTTTSIIEIDGSPVGRLRVVRTPDQLELGGIQLLPAHQSKGIGTVIVRGLLDEAAAAGVRFQLNVEKDNPRARALYQRLGLVWFSETDDEDVLIRPAEAVTRRASP